MGVNFHADSESGLLSYDSMFASLRIAKNPDVRPKKKILVDSVFHTVFFRGACPRAGSLGLRGYCGGSAIARSQGYLTQLNNSGVKHIHFGGNINQARVKHDFETMVRRSMVAQSGVMGRKRPAASQMMPTDELDEPMELGAAAAAPAASTRARHTLSGDDGAEEPSPTRRCLGGLEVGCPLALLKHSVEILQALATAASNAPDVRVPKKDVDRLYKYNDGGRWRRFFKADTTGSPVPRGCADKSSAGADYGKYWFTRAGVDYLDALQRDTHEDLDDASDDQAPRSSISWFSPLSPGAPRSSPAATAGQTDVPRVPRASARIPRGQ